MRLQEFPASVEGAIQSFRTRYPALDEVCVYVGGYVLGVKTGGGGGGVYVWGERLVGSRVCVFDGLVDVCAMCVCVCDGKGCILRELLYIAVYAH